MLKSTGKSALDSLFHTDHKHGASPWLNKPALLEQRNSTVERYTVKIQKPKRQTFIEPAI